MRLHPLVSIAPPVGVLPVAQPHTPTNDGGTVAAAETEEKCAILTPFRDIAASIFAVSDTGSRSGVVGVSVATMTSTNDMDVVSGNTVALLSPLTNVPTVTTTPSSTTTTPSRSKSDGAGVAPGTALATPHSVAPIAREEIASLVPSVPLGAEVLVANWSTVQLHLGAANTCGAASAHTTRQDIGKESDENDESDEQESRTLLAVTSPSSARSNPASDRSQVATQCASAQRSKQADVHCRPMSDRAASVGDDTKGLLCGRNGHYEAVTEARCNSEHQVTVCIARPFVFLGCDANVGHWSAEQVRERTVLARPEAACIFYETETGAFRVRDGGLYDVAASFRYTVAERSSSLQLPNTLALAVFYNTRRLIASCVVPLLHAADRRTPMCIESHRLYMAAGDCLDVRISATHALNFATLVAGDCWVRLGKVTVNTSDSARPLDKRTKHSFLHCLRR
jgi:hypothetical protein